MNDLRRYRKEMNSMNLRPSTVSSPVSSTSLSSNTFLSPVRIPSANKLRSSHQSSHLTRLQSASLSSPLATSSTASNISANSTGHLYPSVDSMSSQSIRSNQSVNEILQQYQKNHDSSIKNNNRKWLQSR